MGMRVLLAALLLTASAGLVAGEVKSPVGFGPDAALRETSAESAVDASIATADLDGWLKRLTSAPNHVGSPHNKENADFIAASLRGWGWDVKIEPVRVLVAYPTVQKLVLMGDQPYAADFTEPAVDGDPDTARRDGVLPGMESYSPDGSADAPLLFVNEGLDRDYDDLERMGLSAKGKVVLVKSTGAGRWVKPRLAQAHGAVGVIIYSDPEADGYVKGDVYPKGAWRTERTVQRGTLGIDAVLDEKGAREIQARRRTNDLAIPVVTIGYGDADHFLRTLGGPVVPARWQGGLPFAYHVGGDAPVHLEVGSDWQFRTLYNVIATLRGSTYPDEWVLRGVHHDAWVYGAWDPHAGTTALLAEARAIGELARHGVRPRRTLIFASWDGEELGILGSKAWVQRHASELQHKAVFYLNNDTTGRGFLSAGGDPSLATLVEQVADDLTDPETGATVQRRRLAKQRVDADARGAHAADVIVPSRLGTGSDFLAFAHRLGVPSLHVRYGYDRNGDDESVPVYHSLYDTYTHYQRFGDPGLAYVRLLARTNARLVLRTANADVLPWRYQPMARALAADIQRLQTRTEASRADAERHNQRVQGDDFRLAAVAYRRLGPPAMQDASWQPVDFAPLEAAQRNFLAAASAFDATADAAVASGKVRHPAEVNAALRAVGPSFIDAAGLPQRPWYRNVLQAPSRKEGEDVAPLPAIGDALEAKRWDEAARQVAATAAAVDRATAALRRAAQAL
jgi:N-acetylated-alpha-linked acidic dipeptidase